jgi:alkanesulfonate monooxygenase SsuD/methylene tetrahydromethanopterin reductase-like flavin-dependent oxidoreductase (luciferase family)
LTFRAGSAFGAKHAKAIFVAGHLLGVLALKIVKIRQLVADGRREPRSIKVFQCPTAILGETDEEA